ncbi:MAG: photosystem II reaction center protein PsbN [Thermosynechococcaceae cyanobacterium MS004]|nr:photosystem II reaction center protein PsbN [Thermosynechococcaceae cyanobacterium MS004]
MSLSDPATVLSITISLAFLAFTGYGIYIAFGPPSTQLDDPYDDHED